MDGSRTVSCRILVIPEDPTYNGAILKPLIERMAAECGKPNARVTVLTNPAIKGIEDLRGRIGEIAGSYAHMDVLICIVDADGKDRADMFATMKNLATSRGAHLLCCAAVQEVEAWLLAGHIEKLPDSWSQIRANTSVKEQVFQRDLLMKTALQNFSGLLARCPELSQLQSELCQSLPN
jgi:hypothetical protein